MPYADPETQKEAKRRWFNNRYRDPEFRESEAERKARWLQTPEGKSINRENSQRNMQTMRRRRAFSSVLAYDEKTEAKAFAEMLAILQSSGAKFSVDRREQRLLLRLAA